MSTRLSLLGFALLASASACADNPPPPWADGPSVELISTQPAKGDPSLWRYDYRLSLVNNTTDAVWYVVFTGDLSRLASDWPLQSLALTASDRFLRVRGLDEELRRYAASSRPALGVELPTAGYQAEAFHVPEQSRLYFPEQGVLGPPGETMLRVLRCRSIRLPEGRELAEVLMDPRARAFPEQPFPPAAPLPAPERLQLDCPDTWALPLRPRA